MPRQTMLSVGNGHDVVEGQLNRRHRLATVLAGVVVARVDVRTGEGDVIEPAFDPDEAKEADDRRQLKTDGDRPYLAVVDRDHLYLPLAPESDRFLPVDDLEGLVRSVEEERLLHDRVNDNRTPPELSRIRGAEH